MATENLTVEQKGEGCALYKESRVLCPVHDGRLTREEIKAELDIKSRLDSAENNLQTLVN